MKIFLLAIILLSDVSMLSAQSIVWRKIIGGPREDISYNCIESKDGGYLATGYKNILPSGSMIYYAKSFITKFDRFGNILWDKIIDDSLYTNSLSLTIIQDSIGNIYLPYTSTGGAYLAKLDPNGQLLWVKNYIINQILYFRGVSFVDNFKNLVLLSLNNFQGIYPTSAITKIDSSGNLIWTKPYYDSIPTLSFYTSHNNSFLFNENSYFICGTKGNNPFILKTDTSGNIIWNKRYLDNEGIYSISQISENTFMASGRADDLGYLYCMKFDSSGSVYWSKNFRNDTVSNNIGFDKIFKNYEGNFVLGTISSINFGRLVIIDSLGNILLSKFYYYPSSFYIDQNNINSSSDSGYIVAGSLDSDNVLSQNNNLGNSQYDILVFKIDKNGKTVSIKNQNSLIDEHNYNTYPNPYNLSFNISFKIISSSNIKISLFDISGKMVKRILNSVLLKGIYRLNVYTPELSSGVYFLKTEINNKSFSKKILLIK